MLEELLGDGVSYVLEILPIEITAFIVVVFVLYRTGTLERLATLLTFWIKNLSNATKTTYELKSELDKMEAMHDTNLERIQVESILQGRAAYDREAQQARTQLFELTKKHIEFLEQELLAQNNFIRKLVLNITGENDTKRNNNSCSNENSGKDSDNGG